MARKATPSINGRKSRRTDTPPSAAEPVAAERPRRGRKPKLRESMAETVDMDEPMPGAEASAPETDEPTPEPPAAAKRGRKPKAPSAPEPSLADESPAEDAPEATAEAPASKQPDMMTAYDAAPITDEPPAKARRGRTPKAEPAPQSSPAETSETAPSAAHWDQATGNVTFDWPAIEQVAAQGGANQAMAKLLLAARAEGANSRWPF